MSQYRNIIRDGLPWRQLLPLASLAELSSQLLSWDLAFSDTEPASGRNASGREEQAEHKALPVLLVGVNRGRLSTINIGNTPDEE